MDPHSKMHTGDLLGIQKFHKVGQKKLPKQPDYLYTTSTTDAFKQAYN
jgi:hypothetical protein